MNYDSLFKFIRRTKPSDSERTYYARQKAERKAREAARAKAQINGLRYG